MQLTDVSCAESLVGNRESWKQNHAPGQKPVTFVLRFILSGILDAVVTHILALLLANAYEEAETAYVLLIGGRARMKAIKEAESFNHQQSTYDTKETLC